MSNDWAFEEPQTHAVVTLKQITEGEDPRTLTGSRATALQELQADEIAVSLADADGEHAARRERPNAARTGGERY